MTDKFFYLILLILSCRQLSKLREWLCRPLVYFCYHWSNWQAACALYKVCKQHRNSRYWCKYMNMYYSTGTSRTEKSSWVLNYLALIYERASMFVLLWMISDLQWKRIKSIIDNIHNCIFFSFSYFLLISVNAASLIRTINRGKTYLIPWSHSITLWKKNAKT